jgi:hypothetical protein
MKMTWCAKVWMRCLVACAIAFCLCVTACDEDNDNGDSGPVIAFGSVTIDEVSYDLGYGEMITVPAPQEGINHTSIGLYTSDNGGEVDQVEISLYHAEDTTPEGTYELQEDLDGDWDGTYRCAVITGDGKNVSVVGGTLSFSRSGVMNCTLTLEGQAEDIGAGTQSSIELDYSGPIVSLN